MTPIQQKYISLGLLALWFIALTFYNIIRYAIELTEERIYSKISPTSIKYVDVVRKPIMLRDTFIIDTSRFPPHEVERIISREIDNRLVTLVRSPEFKSAIKIVQYGKEYVDFDYPPDTRRIDIKLCIYNLNEN